jgi:cyclohexa-1,5-dienecarbonyl-CoA hydratase
VRDAVVVETLDDGVFWRVTFGKSPGNILDGEIMTALTAVFLDARNAAPLKAIVIQGAGPHFSFGASVQEHLPDRVAPMLAEFRELLLAVLESSRVVVAAIRGQCLGGGLELATLAHRIVAHQEATLGQPEISLGVFAPAASILLPMRIARARAEALCLTGASIRATEALAIGLVDDVTPDDPAEVALAWVRTHFSDKSASSLRLAVTAVRADLVEAVTQRLPAMERLYLDELMRTSDAQEGLRAFLEKRPPRWSDS